MNWFDKCIFENIYKKNYIDERIKVILILQLKNGVYKVELFEAWYPVDNYKITKSRNM